MKQKFYKWFVASVFLFGNNLFAQEISHTTAPVGHLKIVNFKALADHELIHPLKKKKRRIEQGEDRAENFKFRGGPAPANAHIFNVPAPQSLNRTATATTITASPAPIISFNGTMDNTTLIPPDIRGAAGIAYIMETTNQEFKIFTKSGAAVNTVTIGNFFVSTGGNDFFDPHILYDPIRNRFIICIDGVGVNGNGAIFLAISQTSDPNGNWFVYWWDGNGNSSDLLDFPLLGFNTNWVVVTANNFTGAGVDGKIYVVNRDSLYNGFASTAVHTFTDPFVFALSPAQTLDSAQATEYMVQALEGNQGGAGFVQVYTITGTASAPVYGAGNSIGVNQPWDESSVGAPQNGSTNTLEDGDTRIGNSVFINNSLWFCQTVYLPVGSPTHDAVQWWQVDPALPVVHQFGRVEDPGGSVFYFYPSISVNANNDALLGYCESSSGMFPSAAYSLHHHLDSANTMESDYLYKPGLASYYKTFGGSRNRWGDYTGSAVDPVDSTFWNFGQWANTANRWGTVIAHIPLTDTNCYAPPGLTSGNITDTSAEVLWQGRTGATGYQVQFREVGTTAWFSDTTSATFLTLYGLADLTNYEWRVQSVCGAGDTSSASPIHSFWTLRGCHPTLPSIVASPSSPVCPGTSVQLVAGGNDSLFWYTVPTSGIPISSGDTLITPPLMTSTIFYAENDIVYPAAHVGPASNSIGSGSNFVSSTFRSVIFDCFTSVKLLSVLVYAQGAGNRTISLRDQAGTILQSATISIPAGTSRVALNFNIPAGTNLELGCSGTINLYRNSNGANYPSYIINGIIAIKGNNVPDPDRYYFFYDWEIQELPCKSPRIPVPVNVLTAPTANYSAVVSFDTVAFTNSSINASAWQWSFGDTASGTGDTSTLANPVHVFSADDSTYQVCLTVTDSAGCTHTICQPVTIGVVGISGPAETENIFVFPNPVHRTLEIYFSHSHSAWTAKMIDITGRVVDEKNITGTLQFNWDVSRLARGMYELVLRNAEQTVVKKIIKE